MKLFCLSPLLLAAVSANQYDPTNVRKEGANQRALKGSGSRSKSGSGSRSKSGSKGKCKDFTGAYDVIESASSVNGADATDVAKIAFTCFDNQEDWDNFEDIVFFNTRRNLGEKKEEERMLQGNYPDFDDVEGIDQLCYFEAIGFSGSASQGIHNYGYAAITTFEKAEEYIGDDDDDDDDDDDLDDVLVPYSQNCAFTTFETEYEVAGFMVKDNVLAVISESPFPYFAHKTTN